MMCAARRPRDHVISVGEVEARVAGLEAHSGGDPESDHGERDGLLIAALRAIAAGHPEPEKIAAAALRVTELDLTLWFA
jgi:hypothetical protein